MTLFLAILVLLPGLALLGPVLVGEAFDSAWVLRIGLGFDVVAIAMGVAAWAILDIWAGGAAAGNLGASMVRAVSGGLVAFGLVFGAVSAARLYGGDDG